MTNDSTYTFSREAAGDITDAVRRVEQLTALLERRLRALERVPDSPFIPHEFVLLAEDLESGGTAAGTLTKYSSVSNDFADRDQAVQVTDVRIGSNAGDLVLAFLNPASGRYETLRSCCGSDACVSCGGSCNCIEGVAFDAYHNQLRIGWTYPNAFWEPLADAIGGCNWARQDPTVSIPPADEYQITFGSPDENDLFDVEVLLSGSYGTPFPGPGSALYANRGLAIGDCEALFPLTLNFESKQGPGEPDPTWPLDVTLKLVNGPSNP